jgi:hypothetical protein
MATIGGWLDGLGECNGRFRSYYGKLYYACSHEYDL